MSADGSYLFVTVADEPLRLEKYDSIKQQKIITMFVLSKLQPSPSGRSNPLTSKYFKQFISTPDFRDEKMKNLTK